MKIVIPQQEAASFKERLSTDSYRKDERDYKFAVHQVLSALLSEENMSRDDFPSLISNVLREPMPDLGSLGVDKAIQEIVTKAVGSLGAGALRSAMANLSGGRFGLAEFIWIPRAVDDYELGVPIADAFRGLVVQDAPLAQCVDVFRDQLYTVCQTLEQKGGFEPNWQLFRVSLSFVAMVLAGYNPDQFTFYSHGALRHGYERYGPEITWPKGSMGEIYAEVCAFVQEVGKKLKSQGVPVKDLIDAQSFIWLSFGASKETEQPKPPTPPIATESVAKDLAAAAFWPIAKAEHLVALVQRWGQILFQGPPGTGKTFVAETLARLLAGDEGRVEVVQFHPSYAYEDFIEGIRPVVTEGSQLAYEVRKGIFMKLADRASKFSDDEFFLVVDELNRANVPRVFGELLYALEYRGPEHTIRLPYSGTETYLSRNITLIATMNTADRSIALVDAAIRRRFRHVTFAPDLDVLNAWLLAHNLGHLADHVASRLSALNVGLEQLLDSDRLIGHTYLMRTDLADVGLAAVWEEDVEPVLQEHLFNQPGEIAKLRDIFLATE